jgi:hypothetical protein
MSQVEELQKAIPRCSLEAEIYPKNPGLRFALEDLFRDFVDYCLVILKCLKRNPIGEIPSTRSTEYSNTHSQHRPFLVFIFDVQRLERDEG